MRVNSEGILKAEALMSAWLPWAVVVVCVLLVALIPWKRPDPKHVFMLQMWGRLTEDESPDSADTKQGDAATVARCA